VASSQAKKIPGVFIVTPEWILKCARSWSHVSEQDFLADEWKAKHTKREPEQQPEGASATTAASAPSEAPKESSAVSGDEADGSQPPPAEDKPVAGILVKPEQAEAKRPKQVSFAAVIDDSGNPPCDDGKEQKPKMVRRSRVIRRPRTLAAAPVAAGVVATGGTFDFLSKIKATKREGPRTSVKAKKAEEAKKATRPASPPKDMDDAFLRLMEAEERENEEEEKRKHSSKDVKDQLLTRRGKRDNSKRAMEPSAAEAGEKRMRLEAAHAAEEEEEVSCVLRGLLPARALFDDLWLCPSVLASWTTLKPTSSGTFKAPSLLPSVVRWQQCKKKSTLPARPAQVS